MAFLREAMRKVSGNGVARDEHNIPPQAIADGGVRPSCGLGIVPTKVREKLLHPLCENRCVQEAPASNRNCAAGCKEAAS